MVPEVYEGERAGDRLGKLGLSLDDVEFALRGADAEARTYTELDPPNTAGIGRWGRTNRLLRERLIPQGWTYDNPRNLPRTISPTGDVAIVATAGDSFTGDPRRQPTTKYAKGVATADAVGRNEQLSLFGHDDEPSGDALATWLLLYDSDETGIRAEVSLAASIDEDGFVDAWTERIILPPVVFDTPPVGSRVTDDRPPIDIAVERR
jgi:hypothetical protein